MCRFQPYKNNTDICQTHLLFLLYKSMKIIKSNHNVNNILFSKFKSENQSKSNSLKLAMRAKSKIGHCCDGRNFFSQLSFLSSQKPRHFMYITWINNHCPPQKHQRGAAIIKHVTVATHLKVRRTEFWSKIPSVAKNTFSFVLLLQLCNFTQRAYYTIALKQSWDLFFFNIVTYPLW